NPGFKVSSPHSGIVGRIGGKKVPRTFFWVRLTPSSAEKHHEPRFKVSSAAWRHRRYKCFFPQS
ncbi:hypothetical protein, partial [[Clostridium] aminophilum]|uniref:hypothetical protein n=1 Tax=[Clostridium] aminophilum TaxID=1526 RepID=UPI001A9A54AB